MGAVDLTFSAVDDLLNAHARGKLAQCSTGIEFFPRQLGPLLEMCLYRSDGRLGPLFHSSWLSIDGQHPFRSALSGSADEWLGAERCQGFLRTVFTPLAEANIPVRMRFLMAARRSAEEVTRLPASVAQCLTAALREMESNVYEHSARPESGVMAFNASTDHFEFVVGDSGVGVLATLREAPEFDGLNDHGRALQIALREGASRYGGAANRGMGFKDLFLGLASLNANLRFRSGDHVLTISGDQPSLKVAQLSQKAFFPGFLISVRCNSTTARP